MLNLVQPTKPSPPPPHPTLQRDTFKNMKARAVISSVTRAQTLIQISAIHNLRGSLMSSLDYAAVAHLWILFGYIRGGEQRQLADLATNNTLKHLTRVVMTLKSLLRFR